MSREKMLEAVRSAGAEKVDLPSIPLFESDGDFLANFKKSLIANHAEVLFSTSRIETKLLISNRAETLTTVISASNEFKEYKQAKTITDPHDLKNVDMAIVESELGVAENGAMWFPETALPHRVLPFITTELWVVIKASDLVENMHVAYTKNELASGYGVFIAGPSKTADIEQSLVIGAHGAKAMTVVVETI